MRYFPRISPNSLKISPKFRANIKIQSPTYAYLFIKTKLFLLHFKVHYIHFNMTYWPSICGKYFLEGSILENLEKYGKTAATAGLINWGNTTGVGMDGFGSIWLRGGGPYSQPIL